MAATFREFGTSNSNFKFCILQFMANKKPLFSANTLDGGELKTPVKEMPL